MKTGGSIYAVNNNGVTDVRAIVRTPKDRYVTEMSCFHKGMEMLSSTFTNKAAAEAYLAFSLTDAHQGDELTISWLDSNGRQGKSKTTVK